MSVYNSVVQKSLTESKIRDEENEISVGDIKLPPGERGESSLGCDLKQIHVDRINYEDEKSTSDITGPEPFSLKHEEIGIARLCKVPKTKVCNSPHCMESHLGLISEICLPDSPSSSYKSNSSFLSDHQSENTLTPSKNDRPQNKSPSPFHNKESSICESSVSNLMYCTSPGMIQSPFDIPLPNQSSEESSTLPKSHTPDINTVENQNYPSVKTNNFDLNINSANSSLDIESNETIDASENVIANLDSKNFSCLLEISEEAGIVDPTIKKNFDDARYSPNRLDSEEETQDFAAIKPKVLGKEQAKKRLMAFSLSKQPNTSVLKKQNILAVSQKLGKEKPPNPNKSGCVQDQFRATISAIEEEKKRMLQNMPNYLFSYSNNLSNVGDSVIPNPSQGTEKTGKEGNDGSDTSIKITTEKDDKDGKKVKNNEQSPNRSKNSRHRRRSSSSSSSKKSWSRIRKYAIEVDMAKDNDLQLLKMETLQDWKSFAEYGFELDSNFRRLKLQFEEERKKEKLKSRKRFWTLGYKSVNEYRPVFNCLKKSPKLMIPLQARGVKTGMTIPFPEKTVKYTRTKPVITWTENPNYATDYYMSRQLLLENCDKNFASVLNFIMEQKGEKFVEMKKPQEKFWYPKVDYFLEIEKSKNFNICEEKDESSTLNKQGRATKEDNNKENTCENDNSKTKQKIPERTIDTKPELSKNDSTVTVPDEKFPFTAGRERRLNLVNDNYLSEVGKDKVPVKEVVVGDVKVKLDLELNSVKVRSKWDSDYDGEDNEKDSFLNKFKKAENKEGDVPEPPQLSVQKHEKEKTTGDVEISSNMSVKFAFNQNCVPKVQEPQPLDFPLNEPKGKLVSEYEEFMKMVTLKAGDGNDAKSNEVSSDKVNTNPTVSAIDLIVNDSKAIKNINPTDWDLESDHEVKPHATKIDYFKEDATDNFSLLLPKYKIKKRVKRKSLLKKKSGKFKVKDKFKKLNKNRKKKKRNSSSESSSSVSSNSHSLSDSDSDPDSDTSDSGNERRKRKKWKMKKSKKRYSSSSSASSSSSSSSSSSTSSSSSSSSSSSLNNSDSKLSNSQKNKFKKKKNKSNKIIGVDNMDCDDLTRDGMFKQLDIDKEQLMKKIEEIDAAGSKISKKKESNKGIDEESSKYEESENDLNAEKNNKGNVKSPGKFEKGKVTSKDDEEKIISQKVSGKFDNRLSKSENTPPRGKKVKKKSKKHKSSSESSSDEGIEEDREGKSIQNFTANKTKSMDYSCGSESDSDSDSRKSKKKMRKKKRKKKKNDEQKSSTKTAHEEIGDWNDHLLSDGSDFRAGNSGVNDAMSWLNDRIEYYRKLKEVDILLGKNSGELKDLGDWEKSSGDESPKIRVSRESTWDEELPQSSFSELSKDDSQKAQKSAFSRDRLLRDNKNKFLNDFDLETNHDSIFNENNLGSVKHDLCSLENSSSIQFFPSLKVRSPNLSVDYQSKRNFHGIGEEIKQNLHKATNDELYSPGHSESDTSDIIEKKDGQRKSGKSVRTKEEIYDPLNSDSDASSNCNTKLELHTIPLPSSTDISHHEIKKKLNEDKSSVTNGCSESSKPKADFIALPFAKENEDENRYFKSASDMLGTSDKNLTKKPMISVKLQQKFQCKVASVFQNDSEDEEVGKSWKKGRIGELETGLEEKIPDKLLIKNEKPDNKKKTENIKLRDESRSKSTEREHKSRSSYDNYKENDSKKFRRRSRTPESKQLDSNSRICGVETGKEKSVCKNVEFSSESESKKSVEAPDSDAVRPIPVLTGLDIRMSENHHWGRSHILGSEDVGYSCDRFDLMDSTHLDSFKLYGSYDTKSDEGDQYDSTDKRYTGSRYDRNLGKDLEGPPLGVLLENRNRKEKRKSRSRSSSPRKKRRSKTPDRRRSPRNRSPKRRSTSPRRRGRSPFSPRRRSSPRSRRYKSSRSPDRKKSKSPRKRSLRRSRSASPKKPRTRTDPPRRLSLSPGTERCREIGVRNLIHLTGIGNDENEMDLTSLVPKSSKFDSPMGFTRSLADSTISDSELSNTFFNRDYPGEYGAPNYPEEVTVNNLITLQNHDADKQTDSPKRLTLDQRIEIELGVPPIQNDQYQVPPQSYPQFPDPTNQYSNSYTCDDTVPHSNSNSNQNFYPSQNPDFNGQFFNGQQPLSNFGQFHQFPRHNAPPLQNSVLQVGNIMEVVPTLQAPPPPLPHSQGHQIMQVGNVLQVVPSPKPTQGDSYGYGVPLSPGNIQKPAPVLPQNNVPNPETLMNPLLKAIQLEREKRKKDREKRRQEREARRKARQLKREAKLMSVNEKLKKSVQDEGLMLGQEVEEDELLEEIEHPSPPVPVEIVTDSSHNSLPPAGKGILITAGFIQKPASEKKEVKFADGICPGEGTSTSGGEDRASPPPKPKLPKEKRYKKRKKKTKLKKKVKVHIIRQVIQDDENDDDDNLSPPPPPPGDPPPVFFARFPFGVKAQYPVYQIQTRGTALISLQFPKESYQ